MKRTNRLSTIISLVLFAAAVIYGAVWLYRSYSGSFITTEAVTGQVTIGGSAEGIIIREETLLESDDLYLDITASEGQKLGANQTAATAMSSELGLERATRIHTLEKSIEITEAALSDANEADISAVSAASDLIKNLSRSVARGETEDIESTVLSLSSAILSNESLTATEEDLQEMKTELDALNSSSSSDTTELKTEVAGVFSQTVDGYEALTPDDLTDLTPSKLQELMDYEAEIPENAYGKLVTDIHWYYACVMDSSEADNLSVGSYAGLDFGRYYSETVYGKVISLSNHEDGKTAVVFQCDTDLGATLSLRQVSAQIVFDTYDGIRIPSRCIRYDEENEQSYVYTVTALKLERKNVTIIYATDDWVIVTRSSDAAALREGNTVVVKGRNLHEGMIVE